MSELWDRLCTGLVFAAGFLFLVGYFAIVAIVVLWIPAAVGAVIYLLGRIAGVW